VLGDNCEIETEKVVESFDDSRIKFLNLPRNLGDQSGPNSVGIRLAVSPIVGILQHDDFFDPWHLEHALAAIEREQLDFYCSGWRKPILKGKEIIGFQRDHPFERRDFGFDLFFPSSTFLFRRDLAMALGDWKPPGQLRFESSRDYLYRAWAAGAKIGLGRNPTVTVIHSGLFSGSYRGDSHFFEDMCLETLTAARRDHDDGLDYLKGTRQVSLGERVRKVLRSESLKFRFAAAVEWLLGPVTERLGLSRLELRGLMLLKQRGSQTVALRKFRGLS
jgi:hypothetical protein